MAGLSTEPMMGYDYDAQRPQYAYPSRATWSEGGAINQNQSRTPHQQHNANVDGTRRSTTPLPATEAIYEHGYPSFQVPFALSSQTDGHDFDRTSTTAISPYETGNQSPCQSYDDSLLQAQTFGTHLHPPPTAYAMPTNHHQQQCGFHTHLPTGLEGTPADWPVSQSGSGHVPYPLTTDTSEAFPMQAYDITYQASPVDFVPTSNSSYENALGSTYVPLGGSIDDMTFNWNQMSQNLMSLPAASVQGFSDGSSNNLSPLPHSPTGSYLEARSLSSSDNGWVGIDRTQFLFNPGEALHGRTYSSSSNSDGEQKDERSSWSSGYVEVSQHAVGSPSSDGTGEVFPRARQTGTQSHSPMIKQESQNSSPILSRVSVRPISIQKQSNSPHRSPVHKSSPPSGRSSPPGRRQIRKNSGKATKAANRKQPAPIKNEPEKKVGRRKGPLRPEQRKQACEIRKMGACLRCRFLKKTCDIGDPCEGCQPHHTRLWNLPCVRIDIRDLGFFMKDWKTHFEQNINIGFSITNIKGHGSVERDLWVTHGYGHALPVKAREVLVREEGCFGLDWVEQFEDMTLEHKVDTARLSTGVEGVSTAKLSSYLDRHIEHGFTEFIDQYFDGTPFVTEMLKSIHRYWSQEQNPVVKKALKMLLAYNLTHHITILEGVPDEEGMAGRIEDQTSKFYGKTAAPVMINFEVKCAMSKMWRDLQKEVLEDLSPLYASIYSKDKFKNWPTILMVLIVLLTVWEEMQFDYHYRIPDQALVRNFCDEMENIPVKVLIGLFSTISQRLPSIQEWDSNKHHNLLNSNLAVCDTMTHMRSHVRQHDQYLRSRCDPTFDRDDFDSLSNKFVSQLVIRPTA